MISHVVVDARDSLCFRCLHCGERHLPLLLPMPCDVHASACRGFALMHKHCPKPAPPSKQVELFDALVQSEQENLNGGLRHVDPIMFGTDIDPETDPERAPAFPDRFAELFPMAHDLEKLRAELAVALQNAGGGPTREQLDDCIRMGGLARFDELAHWARVELAHMNAKENARRFPDLQLPSRLPMPRALRRLLPKPLPKPKRKAKRKRKAKG